MHSYKKNHMINKVKICSSHPKIYPHISFESMTLHFLMHFTFICVHIEICLIGMGNTCKSMADSYQCMTKTTTIL